MKHLGDITLIKGNEAPVVDCVIGGSPCQDLSLAGKRAGLAGARSGLYMEQIRIIKEMRANDRTNGRSGVDVRPRYMVWENVPGAFSTNGGKDFAAVLEEAIRVAEPEAPNVDVPEKGWPTSGCLFDEMGKWSVAYRVLDAQYWGVPQRRRRICLVCDFNGLNAPKIVFGEAEHHGSTEQGGGNASVGHSGRKSRSEVQPLSQGLSGHSDESQQKREETAGDAGAGSGGAIGFDRYNQCSTGSISETLRCPNGGDNYPTVCYTVDQGGGKSGAHSYENVAPTLTCTHGGEPAVAYTYDARGNGDGQTVSTLTGDHQNRITDYTSVVLEAIGINGDKAGTLDASYYKGCGERQGTERDVVCQSVGYEMQAFGLYKDSGIASALKARDYKDATDLIVDSPIAIDRAFFNQGQNALYEPQVYDDGTVSTLVSRGPSAVAMRHIVRRLTPLECERLQGYPDGWTDIGEWVDSKGKKHKEADSPRYKALGNSIALPPWKWVLKRLCACYERDATMASLFDGIGGFPLCWEQLNGKGSCLWASEIEEFPMAVTKVRFGE